MLKQAKTMPRRSVGLLSAAIACTAVLSFIGCGGGGNGAADLILTNGAVYTMDSSRSKADALAVRNGEIVYVGTTEGADAFKGKNTKVEDLKGRLVLPGFIDSHNHLYLRTEAMFWVTLGPVHTVEAYKAAVSAYRNKNPWLTQVRGVGWDMAFVIAESKRRGIEPRQLLDEIVGTDVPAVIITQTHHEIWANTRAIQNAKVTKDTPDPIGSFIERNPATNEPNGIFREFGAQNLIIDKLPQPDFTENEYREAVLSFQKDLAADRGITGAFVPVHYWTEPYFRALQKLDDENLLTVRQDISMWTDENRGLAQVPEFVERRAKYKGRMFKISTAKILTTGVDVTKSNLVWNQKTLNETAAALDKQGFRLYFHCVGPTSDYSATLDAIEYAVKANGARDARHTISHVLPFAIPLIDRFKQLDVRADSHPVPKAFFDAGVPSTSSSDFPVFVLNPLKRIAMGVQAGVSVDSMLASYTTESSRLTFSENLVGSLEKGKQADIVVLDKDILKLDTDSIAASKVLLTYSNGRCVFHAMADTIPC